MSDQAKAAVAAVMVAEGMPRQAACAVAGVHRSNLWRWAEKEPAIRELLKRADERRAQAREEQRRNRRDPPRASTRWPVTPRVYEPSMARRVRSSVRETAKALGVNPATVMAWKRSHPEFAAALDWEKKLARLGQLTALHEEVLREGRSLLEYLQATGQEGDLASETLERFQVRKAALFRKLGQSKKQVLSIGEEVTRGNDRP